MTSQPTQLVIGAGEVGQALATVLDTDLRDIDPRSHGEQPYDILHIAFPYTDAFPNQVHRYVAEHQADTVLIHSTVRPGTSNAHGWNYSPITGKHPDLTGSLRAFTKPIAGPDAFDLACLLTDAGIPADPAPISTTELETSKLIDLLVYGVNIRLAKEIQRHCREHNLNYQTVYIDAARRYNTGYAALGHNDRYTRYVLDHTPGPIGGHCVGYPNLALLNDPRLEALVAPATKEHWDEALD